jgi:hypothetical protein
LVHPWGPPFCVRVGTPCGRALVTSLGRPPLGTLVAGPSLFCPHCGAHHVDQPSYAILVCQPLSFRFAGSPHCGPAFRDAPSWALLAEHSFGDPPFQIHHRDSPSEELPFFQPCGAPMRDSFGAPMWNALFKPPLVIPLFGPPLQIPLLEPPFLDRCYVPPWWAHIERPQFFPLKNPY